MGKEKPSPVLFDERIDSITPSVATESTSTNHTLSTHSQSATSQRRRTAVDPSGDYANDNVYLDDRSDFQVAAAATEIAATATGSNNVVDAAVGSPSIAHSPFIASVNTNNDNSSNQVNEAQPPNSLSLRERTVVGTTTMSHGSNAAHNMPVSSTAQLNQTLINAASRNDINQVRSCLSQHNISVDAMDSRGWTALTIACQSGFLAVVQCLVESGRANVEAPREGGRTPLIIASQFNHLKVVQYLVETGNANVETVNASDGRTALLAASRNTCLKIVQYLVETGGANVKATGNDGKTALDIARGMRSAELVAYLQQQHTPPLVPYFDNGNTNVIPAANNEQEHKTFTNSLGVVEKSFNMEEYAQAMELLQKQNDKLESALLKIDPGQDPLQCLSKEQYDVLVGMIGSTCQTQEEEDEKQAILSSPEHCEFYLLLARKLYCMIHAFETLSSGVVQHSSGGSMRAFATQLLQEKGLDAIEGTKIGVFLSGITGWVQKNLAVIPFLDTAGSLCQLFLTLKDERERYMSVARVADFATIVTITQSNGDGLRCAVERFARLMIRARINMTHTPFVEQQDDFRRYKQFILKMLGESANTAMKEKASKAADCGFAHLMKPTAGSSLHTLLHEPSLEHMDHFHEALAAATLDTTVEEVRQLGKVVKRPSLQVPTPNHGTASTTSAIPRATNTSPEEVFDMETAGWADSNRREIERLKRELQQLKKNQAKDNANLDAGGGLLYADHREEYKDHVQEVTNDVKGLKEQVTLLTEELACARDALRTREPDGTNANDTVTQVSSSCCTIQ